MIEDTNYVYSCNFLCYCQLWMRGRSYGDSYACIMRTAFTIYFMCRHEWRLVTTLVTCSLVSEIFARIFSENKIAYSVFRSEKNRGCWRRDVSRGIKHIRLLSCTQSRCMQTLICHISRQVFQIVYAATIFEYDKSMKISARSSFE